MKILVFYQYFCTPKGAWGTRYYEFARRWVKAGHEVKVICAPYEKSDIQSNSWFGCFEIEGIQVRSLGPKQSNRHSFLFRIFSFLLFAAWSSWYALFEKCDVVITSSGPITVFFPGLLAKVLRQKRWIFEVRDLWPQGAIELGIIRNKFAIGFARLVEKVSYRTASTIVALSPGMKTGIMSVSESAKVEVIPNSSDLEIAQACLEIEFNAPVSTPKYLVYTGSLGTMDDIGQLVFWAQILKKKWPDYSMVILGDGTDRKDLERQIQKLQLGQTICLGPKPKIEVFSWILRSHACVMAYKPLPILDTVSPNKLFDAFACGRPVLHSTQGWLKYHCAEHGWGLAVNPFDAESFNFAMEQLSEPERYAAMVQKSLEMGQTTFNRERLAKKYLDVIQSL